MGGKAPTQTTTQTNANPAYLQPGYEQAAQQANSLYSSGQLANYYPGQTVAGMSPLSTQALSSIASRANAGSPVQAAGNANYLSTLNGTYLNPSTNPYLSGAMDAANAGTVRQFTNATLPGLQSAFAQTGRYGSNAYANTVGQATASLADSLNNSNATMAYGNYNDERNRQFAAATNAPAMAAADYQDANALNQAGLQQQAQDQAVIDSNVARYDATNSTTNLQQYIDILNALKGNTGTVTGTQKASGGNNLFSSILSAGFGAAGAANGLGLGFGNGQYFGK